jgi:hypothetical protein
MSFCNGLTAKGTQCRRKIKDGDRLYCFMHAPKDVKTDNWSESARHYIHDNYDDTSSTISSETDVSDDSEELAMFYVMNRINGLRDENDQLQTKVNNQKNALTGLHNSYNKIKEDYSEFKRLTILKELQQEEQYKELNNIIQELTNETKHYKKQLLLSEINAECYKELLKCEQFFDVLKKIRNKVCPYLVERRFHVENFIKNPKCMDTARKMLNMDGEELRSQYLEYKAIRNRLAHPIFETDINDQVISMI